MDRAFPGSRRIHPFFSSASRRSHTDLVLARPKWSHISRTHGVGRPERFAA